MCPGESRTWPQGSRTCPEVFSSSAGMSGGVMCRGQAERRPAVFRVPPGVSCSGAPEVSKVCKKACMTATAQYVP